MYLCEYIGTFPDDVESHGNSLSAGAQYIHVRTRPDVLSTLKEQCTKTKQKPNQTYTAMSLQPGQRKRPRAECTVPNKGQV